MSESAWKTILEWIFYLSTPTTCIESPFILKEIIIARVQTLFLCFKESLKKPKFLSPDESESDQITKMENIGMQNFNDVEWQNVSDKLVSFNEFIDVDYNLVTAELLGISPIK